ncbi:MAG: rhomboid family intramembrane serine protease [Candidatus Methanoperedens sp.]|nr:rhomboid family intramembrane serine protease [Candidatus Methanoperedens sp.]PKL54385.1 MAG: hypothetical protein CVV36_02040 [Candidatus Methanoperedenaceae archaeon HGW-Methanoperedenaceae-1]
MKLADFLILLCAAFSMYAWGTGSTAFAFSKYALLHGSYWTLLTGLFVHANAVHLAGNMVFLYVFGHSLEDEVGELRTLLVFLTGGILSFILSIPFYPDANMVGASAAIFALMAAVLIIRRPGFSRHFMSPLGPLALLYFILNIIAIQDGEKSNVAYISHVMGFIVGLGFGARWNKEWKKSILYTLILLGAYVVFFYYMKERLGL